ncbi:MAG: signal recognition particle-docking protein FtsY [Acidobacteriota bacterium]|jgi:fused signal recognition particle receptor|nr:signal recognition particle-docking protein FtsY [Acidobacteriota bacterium]
MFFKRSKEKEDAPEKKEKRAGLLARMTQALGATKENLVGKIEAVLGTFSSMDEDALDELEGTLLGADLGVAVTDRIMTAVRAQFKKGVLKTPEDAKAEIRDQLGAILASHAGAAAQAPSEAGAAPPKPQVWMVVGVNGTGKTTTVGKLTARLAAEGRKTLVCAADTFRPAAIEQLAVWAERSGTDLVKSKIGADPSAVLHDALAAATARAADLVLVDTAGRLHTKSNLMKELDKMRRVAGKVVAGAPHETLLVVDATTGQNGLAQAREFMKATGITGLIVTKLDGTAKGGVLFGIAEELDIPVRYIGIGEGIDDLIEFSPEDFINSLFK